MKLAKVTKNNSASLYGQFLTMTIFPLVVCGIIMIFACSYSVKINIEREAQDNLRNVANTVLAGYDYMYAGDYEPRLDGDYVVLYKGDELISGSEAFVDTIKAKSEMEISIIMMDTRLITTLIGDFGARVTGSVVSERIVNEVYAAGKPHFYNNIMIAGKNYFAYYEPIFSSTGECQGMIGVAKPIDDIKASITRSICSNVIIMVLAIGITAFFIILFAHKMILVIKYMIEFMKKLADNNLDVSMNETVLHRDDELGVMGKMLVDLQISLRRLIERDALTGLYNRRSAERKIDAIEARQDAYCVAIGDIDHFKTFNDTYGHECGDVVLKGVAQILNKNITGKGFVARWGGEEFLLVYDSKDVDAAYASLMGIREEFHETDIDYQGQKHKVTMTFGLAKKLDGIPINQLICMADDKLYEGKQGGRDRVIR